MSGIRCYLALVYADQCSHSELTNAVIPSALTLSMGTHMKTTIELSDVLLESAKLFARRSNTTLRALVEAGLSRILEDQALNATQP